MKQKRPLLTVSLAAMLALVGLSACNRGRIVEAAREDRSPTVFPAEQDFMMKAAQANLAEIETARLAVAKGTKSEVKDYANMIQTDHTRALEDLTDLMKNKNVTSPGALPTQTQQDITRMNGLTGPEFDREYANMMVADHEKAVEMFRDQSMTAQDQDVKKYVDNVLPKLEMHLEKAQLLQSSLFRGSK
jgi:putative membrane protein